MSTARAHRYSPIFHATIVPNSVEPLTTTKGDPYTRMSGAVIIQNGKPDRVKTVLAFGKPNQSVHHLLAPGKPVELAVQYSGGALKVIGLPRAKATAAASPSTELSTQGCGSAHNADEPYLARAISEIAGTLWLFGVEADLQESIIAEMLSGESERPVDEPCLETEFSPEFAQVFQHFGHIIHPLLNGGIDMRTAARITDLILDTPAGAFLNNRRLLHEQRAGAGQLAQAA